MNQDLRHFERHDQGADQLCYGKMWLNFTPLQRAVARALAAGRQKPFSRSFRQAVGEEIEETIPSTGRIQGALRKIKRLGLADCRAGDWALANPEFAAWVKERPNR